MLSSNIHRAPAQSSRNCREDRDETTNDGGYGWIIVIVGFFCTFIPDGILVAFGGFVHALKTEFKIDPWAIALAASVSNGLKSLTGLGITNLMDRSGYQKVAMGGGILLSVSMFICSFSQNFAPFIISFGVLGGIGSGMVCLPAWVLIAYFFRERIALATTLSRIGSPMGGFILAPLANYFIDQIGWCNSFIVLSAISIFCPVLCLFLRLPRDNEGDALSLNGCAKLGDIDRRKSNFLNLPLTTFLTHEPGNEAKLQQRRPSNVFLNLDSLSNTSVDRAPSGMGSTLQVPLRDGSIRRNVTKPRRNSFIAEEAQHPVSDIGEEHEPKMRLELKSSEELQVDSKRIEEDTVSKSSGYTPNEDFKDIVIDIATLQIKEPTVWNNLKDVLEVYIVKDPAFFFFCLANGLGSASSFIPLLFLQDYLLEQHLSMNSSAMVIAIIQLHSALGRLPLGWMVDLPFSNSLLISMVLWGLSGIACLCFPFVSCMEHYIILGVFAGIGNTAVSIQSLVLIDIQNKDALPQAFGMLLFCEGIIKVIFPPLAGGVATYFGDPRITFWIGGLGSLTTVICCGISYMINRFQNRGPDCKAV